MGNFHCIPKGCGRVVYQKYIVDSIKLVYPNHGVWTFRGKQLQVKHEQVLRPGQNPFCCANVYDVQFTYKTTRRMSDGRVLTRWETYTNHTFLGDLDTSFASNGFLVDNNTPRSPSLNSIFFRSTPCDKTTGAYRNYETTGVFWFEVTSDINIIKWDFKYTHNLCQYDCQTTVTGIDENGEPINWKKVYYRCPDIIKGDCRLEETINEIEVDKVPYLQRIEVRDHAIELATYPAPLLRKSAIPSHCLNIYKTYTLAAPNLSEYVPAPGVVNPYQFIQQICSDTGCPPPEYEVLCDCECKSCPDDTCPVICHGVICCHEKTTGKAIKSIPIDQYCGEIN